MIVTRRQVCDIITDSMNNDIPLEGERLEAVINAVNADVQVRDWLLGIPNEWSLEDCIKLMQHLSVHAPGQDVVPFVAIQAMYQYELGDKYKAAKLLEYAHRLDPNYTLVQLLAKVMGAGYPSVSFTAMRIELHPKVVEACYGSEGDFVITERGTVHEHI